MANLLMHKVSCLLANIEKESEAVDKMVVVAGIVLFNPDIDRLEENIEAVMGQVSHIFLWDNASLNRGDIESLISSKFCDRSLTLLRSDRNVGLAVAYNHLAIAALDWSADALFLLDQDSITGEGCVRELSLVMERECECAGIVAARHIDLNKRDVDNRPDGPGVQLVDRAITSGSLVNLQALCAVGGYDELLFVDWVDFDFCYRLVQHGYKVEIDNSVSILHEVGHMEFAGYLPMRNRAGKWRLMPQYRSNHSYARRFDQARSIAIVCAKNKGTDLGAREKSTFVKETITKMLVEKRKLSLLKARVMGWREGRRAYEASISREES